MSLIMVSCSIKAKQTVKSGFFDSCKSKNVEELVDGYLENPTWSAFVASDNNTYVNVTGRIKYSIRSANNEFVKIQFLVDGDRFAVNTLEINYKPRNLYQISSFVGNMCNSK